MLERLYVENFKAWKKLDISFGHVTGLFGTNSSGKSSILQFLLLLKQSKNTTDRGLVLDFGAPDQLVNLGSYKDVVHVHKERETLGWQVTWTLPQRLVISDPSGKRTDVLASGDRIELKSSANLRGKIVYSDQLEYRFEGFRFGITPKRDGATEFQLTTKAPEGKTFRFIRNKARAWALPGPVKTYLFPDQAKTYFQNSDFLSLFESAYEAQMDSIFYLGPLREYPRREYPWSGTSPVDVGKRGERTVEAILSATLRGEKRNLGGKSHYKPFQEMIAYWLKELGLIQEFRIEEIGSGANLYRAVVKRDGDGPLALLTDVGFGVSQVLPALVLLYYVPVGSTVIMEQPELHLHPSVQSGLADVILKVAETRNLQVIVESHSEHMLQRFQRRVAEERFPAKDIKLFFCEMSHGESRLINLQLDIFGQIQNWPTNFFGNEMGEIAATRRAVLTRKLEEQVS